jgi:hypothetical protein
MKKIFILSHLFLAASLLSAAPSRQAKDRPKMPQQQENRFLFIVDISSAMRGYSNEVVQNVGELLQSDMRGEFREHDTIGLWTYNDTLHPEFPMQVWSAENKSTVLADMTSFLEKRRYEKRAHLERVMPALSYVIKNSERITVILIFDGEALIHGTPFDREINDLQKKYARELRASHVPFVLVFAARDGVIYDYTINYPGVIAIPHTAYPEKPAETNAPVAEIPVPAPAPLRIGPSIILSGTNKVFRTTAPPPAPVVAAVETPVSPTPTPPAAPPPVLNTPAPAPVSQPAIAVATSPPHEVAPAQTQPTPPPVASPQNPAPINETPQPHAQPESAMTDNQQPEPAPPVARIAPVASISPPGTTQIALFVVAFSLLTIAVVLVVFLIRRSRNPKQPSLISQSIERPR